MKSSNIKAKQLLYKPIKEKFKVMPRTKSEEVTFQQVVDYFVNLSWKHRGFLLLTALILSWTLFLVVS